MITNPGRGQPQLAERTFPELQRRCSPMMEKQKTLPA